MTGLDVLNSKIDTLLDRRPEAERFFSIQSTATYCGLSIESVRRLIASGRLTALRPIGGRVVLDRREIESLVLSSTTVPRRGRGRRNGRGA